MHGRSNSTLLLTALAISFLIFGSMPQFAHTASQAVSETNIAEQMPSSNSLSKILNTDGTLDQANLTNGSFDAKGYRMEYTPAGAPRFVPELAPDDFWDPQFGKNGVNGEITAMATQGSNVYVSNCVAFTCSIMKWDGNTWSQLGTGSTNEVVYGIVVSEPAVYIGGAFTSIGSVPVNYVAQWNGSAWSAIGSGTTGVVFTMLATGGAAFYVGGNFDSAGGVPGTSRVAAWSAGVWSPILPGIGTGIPAGNNIYAIKTTASANYAGFITIYAAGYNTTLNRGVVWRMDLQNWMQVAGNFDRAVRSLTVVGNELYVVGNFFNVDGIPGTTGIAKYNGATWSAVGGGMDVPDVRTVVRGPDGIYAGGSFSTAGGRLVNNVAKWSPATGMWSELTFGTNGPVNAIALIGAQGSPVVGGNFTLAGLAQMNHIGTFNGTSWSPLRSSLNGTVLAVAVMGTDIYVGGSFTSANGVPGTAYIARWNGTQWSRVGNVTLNGAVNALAVTGSKLYVGGNFTNIGPYFAFYQGGWAPYCEGLTGQVLAIAVSPIDPIDVFVGGVFTSANDVPGTSYIARCSEFAWQPLDAGVNNVVNSIVTSGIDTYVGGAFTSASSVPGTFRIAKWSGGGWFPLGEGASNVVVSLAKDTAGNIYAGGAFTSMDNVPNTLHIAKWNGSTWSALGTGINGVVWSVSVARDVVYAGGQFSNAGGIGANNVAAWKNGAWKGLGSGTNGIVRTVLQTGQSVYVGGGFGIAGGKPSYFFGRYRLPGSTPFDFDGDSKSDVSIFRPSVGEWWILRSADLGHHAFQFGSGTDRLAATDFTGDGKCDVAFFRPSNGEWFILRSEDLSYYSFPFGQNGDVPVPADYDGDGRSDPAVYRPSNSTWYIVNSSGGTSAGQFGSPGDKPVPADYDGDGRNDLAVFHPTASLGEWWLLRSTLGVIAVGFGTSTDKLVPGDYTGDGKADMAIWQPSSGTWFVIRSENFSYYGFPFGSSTDIPVPGDYDGDGLFDAAVFRPTGSGWFINRSSGGTTSLSFGAAGDVPVESAFVR